MLTRDWLGGDERRGRRPDFGLCGYLPLAIRAAGSQLAVTPGLEPEDYAEQLGNERTRLKWITGEGVDVSVEAAFNLS